MKTRSQIAEALAAFTDKDVAQVSGVSAKTVSRMRLGDNAKVAPSFKSLTAVLGALEVMKRGKRRSSAKPAKATEQVAA